MCSALLAVSTGDPLSCCSSSACESTWYGFAAEYGHDRWPKIQTVNADHTLTIRRYGAYDSLVGLGTYDECALVHTRRRTP